VLGSLSMNALANDQLTASGKSVTLEESVHRFSSLSDNTLENAGR